MKRKTSSRSEKAEKTAEQARTAAAPEVLWEAHRVGVHLLVTIDRGEPPGLLVIIGDSSGVETFRVTLSEIREGNSSAPSEHR